MPAFDPRQAAAAPGAYRGGMDTVESLTAGHVEINAQLRVLEALPGRLAARGVDSGARRIARDLLCHFDGAALEHRRDEDEHLFPLLRARAGELGRPEVSAVINDVQTDHPILDEVWSRLRQPLAAIAHGRAAALDARDVAAFAWLYRHQMDEESAVILPFAREALA
jgi:hypothetical protein